MSKTNPQQPVVNNFNPGYRFLHLAKSNPFLCLAHVYSNFRLPELLNIWRSWVHCAVCAEYSAFSEDDNRRYLLQFGERVGALIEALHCVLVKWMDGRDEIKKYIVDKENIRYRDIAGQDVAYKCIEDFTRQYRKKQVKKYFWAMLECVLTDGENFDIVRKNLLFDYEAFLSVGRAPFYFPNDTFVSTASTLPSV